MHYILQRTTDIEIKYKKEYQLYSHCEKGDKSLFALTSEPLDKIMHENLYFCLSLPLTLNR
jgi:hypothetical protein